MYQTRDTNGELREFNTFKEALNYSYANSRVWKISWFADSDLTYRIRLVRTSRNEPFTLELLNNDGVQRRN